MNNTHRVPFLLALCLSLCLFLGFAVSAGAEGALIYSKGIDLTVTGRGSIIGQDSVNPAMGIRTMGGSLTLAAILP